MNKNVIVLLGEFALVASGALIGSGVAGLWYSKNIKKLVELDAIGNECNVILLKDAHERIDALEKKLNQSDETKEGEN